MLSGTRTPSGLLCLSPSPKGSRSPSPRSVLHIQSLPNSPSNYRTPTAAARKTPQKNHARLEQPRWNNHTPKPRLSPSQPLGQLDVATAIAKPRPMPLARPSSAPPSAQPRWMRAPASPQPKFLAGFTDAPPSAMTEFSARGRHASWTDADLQLRPQLRFPYPPRVGIVRPRRAGRAEWIASGLAGPSCLRPGPCSAQPTVCPAPSCRQASLLARGRVVGRFPRPAAAAARPLRPPCDSRPTGRRVRAACARPAGRPAPEAVRRSSCGSRSGRPRHPARRAVKGAASRCVPSC